MNNVDGWSVNVFSDKESDSESDAVKEIECQPCEVHYDIPPRRLFAQGRSTCRIAFRRLHGESEESIQINTQRNKSKVYLLI